jgi:serine protease inhibitor
MPNLPRWLRKNAGPLLALLAINLLTPSCALFGSGGDSAPVPMPESTPAGTSAGARSAALGLKLYAEMLKGRENDNLSLSPLSVMFALAVVRDGAAGTTRAEVEKLLDLDGSTKDLLDPAKTALPGTPKPPTARPSIHDLAAALSNRKDAKVTLATAAWLSNRLTVNPAFAAAIRDDCNADLKTCDFSAPGLTGEINGWVSKNTAGKIERAIDGIAPGELAMIVNALYFKGEWMQKFKKSNTHDGPFNLTDGTQVQTPMMQATKYCVVFHSPDAVAVGIPFRQKGFVLVAVMPGEKMKLADLQAFLTAENWQKIRAGMKDEMLPLTFPKFTLRQSATLVPTLSNLGMASAFTPQADFSGIGTAPAGVPLFVTSVRHETFVDVNEDGAEAAASTSAGFGCSAVRKPGAPIVFDRPFVYAIVDRVTGAVLFLGQITNPLAAK